MSVLPKIQALIERAAHPDTPVEEARTSAVIAARLIKEHQIRLVENGHPVDAPRPSGGVDFDISDLVDMIFRGTRHGPWAAEREAARRRAYETAERAAAQAEEAAKKRPRGPKTRRAKKCPHGNTTGRCFSCDIAAAKERLDRERARSTRPSATVSCPHGKQWPTCEACWPTDFFGQEHAAESRRVWTAVCPRYTYPNSLACTCCGTKIEPGERMLWVGGESVTFTSPITHERCSAHWAFDTCTRCGKRTT